MNAEQLRTVVSFIEQRPNEEFGMECWGICFAGWVLKYANRSSYGVPVRYLAEAILGLDCCTSLDLFYIEHWTPKSKQMYSTSCNREERLAALRAQVEFVIAHSQNLVL